MSNPNRDRGHRFEREIVQMLKEMGYEAVSSRQESRSADARGIDIVSDFPYHIQAKSTRNQPNFHTLLTETDAEVVFWRKQEKKGSRFFSQGDYAVLPLEELFKLIKQTDGHNKTVHARAAKESVRGGKRKGTGRDNRR